MAIYTPNFLNPSNTTIDSTIVNLFQCTVQGSSIDSYQLKIYTTANVVVYDSTKLALSPNLYQNSILSHSLPANTLTNGNQYSFIFSVWQGTLTVNSRQTPFFCYSAPVLTMSVPPTITSKKYLFQAIYSQAQSISINYFYMVFLDSNNNVILQTLNSYSGDLQYTYDGFLSNNSYQVYTVVVNQQNVTTQSPTYTFTVTYSKPSIITIPTTTLLPDLSAVQINWSPPVQITGTVTGTSAYVSGLFTQSNTGLLLNTTVWNTTDSIGDSVTTTFDTTTTYDDSYGASFFLNNLFGKVNQDNYVEFDVAIPELFTATIDYIPSETFNGGKMVRFEDVSGDYYEIGYDTTLGCYYYNNNNFILNGTPKEFVLNPILIAIKGIEVLIIYNNVIYEDIYPY